MKVLQGRQVADRPRIAYVNLHSWVMVGGATVVADAIICPVHLMLRPIYSFPMAGIPVPLHITLDPPLLYICRLSMVLYASLSVKEKLGSET